MGQPLVTALLRGLDVLRCFTEQRKVLGCSEIARLTKLPQPTVWRLCQTLSQAGYLTEEPEGKGFRLGLAVLTLGFAAISALDLADLVRPDLQSMASTFGAAAGLTGRQGLSMICLQRFEAPDAMLTVNWRIGSMVPIASSGVGWAYLAALSLAERDKLIAEITESQSDLWRRVEKGFGAAMKDYSKLGYIVNVDVQYAGLTTIAVPVNRTSDATVFVMNCTTLTALTTNQKIRREIGPAMIAAAKQLSEALRRPL